MSSKIALDNLLLTQKKIQEDFDQESSKISPSWFQNPVELIFFFLIRIGGFTSNFLLSILIITRKFFDRIIEIYVKKKTQETMECILDEENMIFIIQSLQNTVIDGAAESTEEEKKLRAELTQRRLDQFLEDNVPKILSGIMNQKRLRFLVHNIIKAAQFPRLNKQLAFVLLDAIINEARRKSFDFPILNPKTE